MTNAPFGNHPSKIEKYRAFWNRDDVVRPLAGFTSSAGFLCRSSPPATLGRHRLSYPEMIDPAGVPGRPPPRTAGRGDHRRRYYPGACPALVAIPWLPGILGSKLRILPDNVLGGERTCPGTTRSGPPRLRPSLVPEIRGFRRIPGAGSRWPFPGQPLAGDRADGFHAVLRGYREYRPCGRAEKSAELLARCRDLRDASRSSGDACRSSRGT
jgi:hypothetical protein